MATIHIQQEHNLGITTAKERVTKLAEQLHDRLSVETHWEANKLIIHRAGADGTILVEPNLVTVDVDLGVLLAAFKDAVEGELRGFLSENLDYL